VAERMEILVVRKSGPVQSMRLGAWLIYLLVGLLLVMAVALGVGGYLFYRQHLVLGEMVRQLRQLGLRTERLEYLVQEQETQAVLKQQAAAQPQPQPKARPQAQPKPSAAPSPQPSPSASQAPSEVSGAASAPEPQPSPPPEPTSSDVVDIRNIRQRFVGGELVVTFDVANARPGQGVAEGYVSVILRGERQGKPWVEAWPPQRLTPLGRPENYRRGTPFAVQRYRRITARFALGDKKLEQLEFVVFSRQGELLLVHRVPVAQRGARGGR